MAVSGAPEVSGIKVSIGANSIGHLDSIGSIIDKSRGVQKYTPLNDGEYDEIVSLGSLTQGQFTATVLYNPSASEGINDLEDAIDTNVEVQLKIELNDAVTTTGTTITQTVKVSSFKVDGEKDGLYKASFTAERIGDATVAAAA